MIDAWSSGVADAHMAESILVEQAGMIRKHPWWIARARLTLDLLDGLGVRPPSRVVDVGCGWGVTLDALERRGYRAAGLDVSRQALEMLDAERAGRSLIQADLTRPWPGRFEPFDAVLALDVIEHLDDDRAAVARLGELTRSGGVAIVSVPALPEMFGEFDRIQGHRRRYRPETLAASFDGSVLELERVFWWGSWMVPLLHRQRRRPFKADPGEPASITYGRYLKLPPRPAPWLMGMLFAAERRAAIGGRLARGTSLFAVARRIDYDRRS